MQDIMNRTHDRIEQQRRIFGNLGVNLRVAAPGIIHYEEGLDMEVVENAVHAIP